MKILLPLLILLAVVLGCANRGTSSRDQRAPDRAPSEPKPTIQYSKPRWTNESRVNLLVSFQVMNTSDRPLEFVRMEASFYDKNGNFVRSEQPYIAKYTSLAPGEKSSATVQTRYDPQIKSVSIDFSCKGEKAFGSVAIDATEVPRLP